MADDIQNARSKVPADSVRNLPRKDPEFNAIKARNQFDFELHVKKAMEAGMSREEAEAHAREDMAGEDEGHVDAYAKQFRDEEKQQ